MSDRKHRRAARRALPGLAAAAVLVAAVQPAAADQVHRSELHDFRVVTVVDGLNNPWAIAFLPDGDMLVTERPGRVRIVRDGRLLDDPVEGVPEVLVGGQGGLLDLVLHPDFESNRLVYLSFAKPDAEGSASATAVVRARFENDRLNDVEEVFTAQPYRERPGHHGARMVFDADGYLFVSVGDRMAPPEGDLEEHPAQRLDSHDGTIVRLYDDGRVPEDNPFVDQDGALPEIWSYGHRNPQGLTIHPETGDIWSNEHGPQGGDELNLIRPGLNYGWPVVGFGVQYGPGDPIHVGPRRPGMEDPVHHWTPSIGTSGIMVYTGDRFPNWRGSVFNGGLAAQHQRLARVGLDGQRVTGEEILLPGAYRLRDVRQSPDGYIYLAVDHRAGEATPILRLEPAN